MLKISLALGLIALLGTAGVKSQIQNAGEDKSIDAMPIENVFNWVDVNECFYDEVGAHGIRKYNSTDKYANGIGLKQQFYVGNNEKISLTFQIPDYNHDDRTLLSGRRPVKVGSAANPYDIWLHNVKTNFNVRYRFWGDNTLKTDQFSSYVQFCEESNGWNVFDGGYFSGVFTNGSEFTISYDSTNFMSFYCDWKAQDKKMSPFFELDNGAAKKTQYLEFMQEHFGNTDEVEIWFAHEQLAEGQSNEVVIKEINGQSLAVSNNKFNDTVNPLVHPIEITEEGQIFEIGVEYTLKTEKYVNDPSTKATFYTRPMNDATCAIDSLVAHSKLLAKHSSDVEFKELGTMDSSACTIKQISFDKAGSWDLKLQTADEAGNIGESEILTINVIKGYSITLAGDVPTTAKTNEQIVLPTATASDANGVERSVTVKVEDPLGLDVPVTNYTFTPTQVGIYYVVYSSSYSEGGNTIRAPKVEREIIVTKQENPTGNNDNNGENGGCAGSIASTSVLACLLAVISVTLLLKKKED